MVMDLLPEVARIFLSDVVRERMIRTEQKLLLILCNHKLKLTLILGWDNLGAPTVGSYGCSSSAAWCVFLGDLVLS